MFRIRAIIASGILLQLLGGRALAQVEPIFSAPKELAKAKFAAAEASIPKLMEVKLAAARAEYDARQAEFFAGRGTLDIILEASRDLLDAELEAYDRDPGAFERRLDRNSAIESANQRRYWSGRIPLKDWMQSKRDRIDAEIQWLQALGKKEFSSVEAVDVAVPLDFLESKELAREKFETSSANSNVLGRARLEAARVSYIGRYYEFLAGRATLAVMLETSRTWLEDELALSTDNDKRIIALEREWESSWITDRADELRYQAGRIRIQDFLQSRYYLLLAQIRLIQAAAGTKTSVPLQGATWFAFDCLAKAFHGVPTDLKRLAKAKAEALHGDIQKLVGEKLMAARGQYEHREQEFVHGRETLDILLESSRNLLDAQREAGEEETTILREHWERLVLIEAINRRRYAANRIPMQDYMQTVHARASAEIDWLRALVRLNGGRR
ncbi:MAG TPA: hypothetical protein VK395_06610 [Gemmataceae bacterium]|nr:hypothetical protein [Gemmataceae bacterium]